MYCLFLIMEMPKEGNLLTPWSLGHKAKEEHSFSNKRGTA